MLVPEHERMETAHAIAPSRWVTVESGSLARLLVLQAELDANGIPTLVPELNIGIVDPFLRGGGTGFEYQLQVPASAAERARALLAAWDPKELALAEHAVHGADDDEAAPQESGLAELRQAARRMRWCVANFWFAPYGLWLAFGYWLDPRRAALCASERRANLTATVLLVAFTGCMLVMLALWFDLVPRR